MKVFFYLSTLVALVGLSGCASGGFKLTREYARWVNSKHIILRIVLYILTSVVFAVTMLIDMVIFNTMDFWEGKVSQGTYEFEAEGKKFHARHEILPDSGLKLSTIQVKDSEGTLVQTVMLRETADKQIELSVDGKLRARVNAISDLPVASLFDGQGRLVENRVLWFASPGADVARH